MYRVLLFVELQDGLAVGVASHSTPGCVLMLPSTYQEVSSTEDSCIGKFSVSVYGITIKYDLFTASFHRLVLVSRHSLLPQPESWLLLLV